MDEKGKLLGNFEKVLKIFDEKINFHSIFILENLLLKIENLEITAFFQQFLRFQVGLFPLFTHARPFAYCVGYIGQGKML